MNRHTAVIWYWPGHSCYSCDNACCRIIAKNSVCGFTIFSSSTKDIDFSITYRHATILLFQNIQVNTGLLEKKKNKISIPACLPQLKDSIVTVICKQTVCYSLLKKEQKAQQLEKAATQSYRKGYFRSKPSIYVAHSRDTVEYSWISYSEMPI